MTKYLPKRVALPPADQMRALIRSATRLHHAPPGERWDVLLAEMLEIFDADAAATRAGGDMATRTRTGRPFVPGRTPAALLRLARGLSRVVCFTSIEMDQNGWPPRRPRGMQEAIYSLAPPLGKRAGLCYRFISPSRCSRTCGR
jgi:hypothetical protein